MEFIKRHGRGLCAALALSALGLVAAALALAEWWGASACYLCVFQRILCLGLFLTLGSAAALWPRRMLRQSALLLALLFALVLVATAGYQSWLQWFPALEISCGSGTQNPIERLVEWLTPLSPTLFMALGFCEDDELRLLGLSLATWALLAGIAYLTATVALLRVRAIRQ